MTGTCNGVCPGKNKVFYKCAPEALYKFAHEAVYFEMWNHDPCGFILWLGQLHIDGLVQDCSSSSVLAMDILQSWTKSLICG